jgi:NAD(P) transhydrogenase subunit alpha
MQLTTDPLIWLTIFVLAIFVGIEVISKVSSTLHTPLMSGANAIHGVILIGAILVAGSAQSTPILILGLVAVVLASINMVGGFVVTDRMLVMFSRPKRQSTSPSIGKSSSDASLGSARLFGRRGLLHRRPQGVVLTQERAPREPDRRCGSGAGLRDCLSRY